VLLFAVLLYHWYIKVPPPAIVAVIDRVAVSPVCTKELATGCVLIVGIRAFMGGGGFAITVTVATELSIFTIFTPSAALFVFVITQ
jgi:hypothetical protein